jgi:tetratricopeptide (TPR) repeat protein
MSKPFKNRETYLVIGFISLYVIVNLIYGFYEDATWDDDCPARYYNTLDAFNNPKHFISKWSRPLFVLIFAPIVHLGRDSIFISMVLFTAIGAYYLYKGIKQLGYANAFMIIPFLLFQTYFFCVSRNAETEPLSVLLLCLGFYFLVKKKWLGFVIVGGLMPLARLELSVLLIFWGWYLLKEKQFKYIPILLVPVFLWNLAGFVLEGDWNFLYKTTIGAENKSNRYGHTTFGHYFQRYIYVIGPVIYLFFITGIINKLKQFKFDMFLWWQFVAGFMLYVIFSWKLNLGNAAGFLRNLVPLSPLVAILALEGYNFFTESFLNFNLLKKGNNDTINLPDRDFKYISETELSLLSSKKRNTYHKRENEYQKKLEKIKSSESKKIKKKNSKLKRSLIWSLLIIIFVGISTYIFHSFELRSHHKLTSKVDYTNLYWVSATILIVLFSFFLLRNNQKKNLLIVGTLLGVLALSFTAKTEPPNANMSPERNTMQEVSDIFKNSYISNEICYGNHIWFHWANSFDKNDTSKFNWLTVENLNNAKIGEIGIYENHYSHRLFGDVPKDWFSKRIDWVELDRNISTDKKFYCMIYQKSDSTLEDCLLKLNTFLNENNHYFSYLSRAEIYRKQNKYDSAIIDLTTAIGIDSTLFNGFFNRGNIYFLKRKFENSKLDFKQSFKINPKSADAVHNIGVCFANMNNRDSALSYYDKAIKLNPKFISALNNKARILKQMNKKDKALAVYNKIIKLDKKNNKIILERAQIYFEKKNFKLCRNDLSTAIKLNPKNVQAYFVRGICHQNLKNQKAACDDFVKAAQGGHPNAQQYINRFCVK